MRIAQSKTEATEVWNRGESTTRGRHLTQRFLLPYPVGDFPIQQWTPVHDACLDIRSAEHFKGLAYRLISKIQRLGLDGCAIEGQVSIHPHRSKIAALADSWSNQISIYASPGKNVTFGHHEVGGVMIHELGHFHYEQHFLRWLIQRQWGSIHRQKFPWAESLGASRRRNDRYIAYGLNIGAKGYRRQNFDAWHENYAEAFMLLYTLLHVRHRAGNMRLPHIQKALPRYRPSAQAQKAVLEGLAPTVRLIVLCMRQRGHPLSAARRRRLSQLLPKA